MELKKFMTGFCLVVIVMSAISWFAFNQADSLTFRPEINVFLWAAPAFLVWFAEGKGLNKLCGEYLSLKNINWKQSVVILATTAVWFMLIPVLTIYIAGNILGCDSFGHLNIGILDIFGFSGFDASSLSGYIAAVAVDILLSLVVGSVAGLFSVFSEIAWRGFLPKHIRCSRYVLPLAVGVIWTLWDIPTMAFSEFHLAFFSMLLKNVALSYFLIEVVRKCGSIWVSSAVFGIIVTGMFVPIYTVASTYALTAITAFTALSLWGITLLLCRTDRVEKP